MGKKDPEREEQKAQERAQKRRAQIEKHLVECPHCGEKVLDHMTKCPKCGGVLVPRGYTPMDPKTERTLKIVGWVIGIAAVIVFIVLTIVYNQ